MVYCCCLGGRRATSGRRGKTDFPRVSGRACRDQTEGACLSRPATPAAMGSVARKPEKRLDPLAKHRRGFPFSASADVWKGALGKQRGECEDHYMRILSIMGVVVSDDGHGRDFQMNRAAV